MANVDLKGRNFLKLLDFTQEEILYLIDLAADLKKKKKDGVLTQVQLYPISLGMGEPRTRRGTPVMAENDAVLRYLAELSRPFGTEIRIDGGVGFIDLK